MCLSFKNVRNESEDYDHFFFILNILNFNLQVSYSFYLHDPNTMTTGKSQFSTFICLSYQKVDSLPVSLRLWPSLVTWIFLTPHSFYPFWLRAQDPIPTESLLSSPISLLISWIQEFYINLTSLSLYPTFIPPPVISPSSQTFYFKLYPHPSNLHLHLR